MALFILFIVSSYIPVLMASTLFAMTFKKVEAPRFDASSFTYNKPDSAEMAKILKQVNAIQDSVTKL